ncbi:hypothetical protein HU200_008417 [Digitaria exilis]|uniref:Hydrophobic seed protein domain-containing protein n=1 Tax=Digitaria exilis TaxID=1010633 RepID=A0A835FLQ3_9POAL|nr:hypothetical protein HU200_008417 [Digitaria exilis]
MQQIYIRHKPTIQAFALFLVFNLLVLGMATDAAKCPIDALNLVACANVLTRLVVLAVGAPGLVPCCSVVAELDDSEAAGCLCAVIKGDVLGTGLNLPIDLKPLLISCAAGTTPSPAIN